MLLSVLSPRKGTSDAVAKCRLFSYASISPVHRLSLLSLVPLSTFALANFVLERYERCLNCSFWYRSFGILFLFFKFFLLFLNISRCLDMSVGYPKLMPSTKCHFILQNRYNKFVSNEKKPLFYIVRSLLLPVLLANDWRSSLLQRCPNWSVKLASTEILYFQLSLVY